MVVNRKYQISLILKEEMVKGNGKDFIDAISERQREWTTKGKDQFTTTRVAK